mmetsp:Transcript_13726/g.15060  ORF Transcript_13726/g.15060 Transcript_13726/m.15060 type:complete len:238 (-) Transcript_13726:458-1171(-)
MANSQLSQHLHILRVFDHSIAVFSLLPINMNSALPFCVVQQSTNTFFLRAGTELAVAVIVVVVVVPGCGLTQACAGFALAKALTVVGWDVGACLTQACATGRFFTCRGGLLVLRTAYAVATLGRGLVPGGAGVDAALTVFVELVTRLWTEETIDCPGLEAVVIACTGLEDVVTVCTGLEEPEEVKWVPGECCANCALPGVVVVVVTVTILVPGGGFTHACAGADEEPATPGCGLTQA